MSTLRSRLRPVSRVSEDAWIKLYRTEALGEQDGRCCYCFEPLKTSAATGDHKKPRSRGGATARDNIAAACARCNLAKGCLSAAVFKAMIKRPAAGMSLRIWLAWSRRRIWLAASRACARIERAAA